MPDPSHEGAHLPSHTASLAGTPQACPNCRGNGRVEMLEHCPVCKGDGLLTGAIYTVLVDECGAYDSRDERRAFASNWPGCREYRFPGGRLGFGGKVWSNRGKIYVTCYPEDATPEREAMIDKANARLVELVAP